MFRSIRTQLLLIQISSLVLLLVIGLSAIAQVRRLSMDSTRQYALAAAMQAKGSIETILENVRVSATSLCYSSSVQEILTTEETDRLRLAELHRQYSGSVSYAINTNSNIVDVCLVSSAGETYAFGTQAPQVLAKALEEYARSGAEGEHFTGFFGPAGGTGTEYYAYLLPVNSAIPGEGFSKQVGLCLVLCRTSAVLEILRTAVLEGVDLSLSYGEDGVLSARGGADSSSLESQQFPLEQGSWTLLQRVDPRAAFVEDRSSQLLILSFLLVALLGTTAFLLFSYRNISLPVMQLRTQLLRNAEQPDATAPVRISTSNELQSIAVEINRMLEQIRESTRQSIENQDRLYAAELLQRKLQFSALQSQINPHFLYNTLSCIRGIALENDQDEIASITVKMAKIFRYSVKGDTYVRVRDELGIIRRYVEIMNVRMNDKFRTRFDVPEEILDCWTVKMVLQPLVENAIFHGLESLSRAGELSVCGRLQGEEAFAMEIRDNGAGISAERLEAMRQTLAARGKEAKDEEVQSSGMGVGLININRKIQLLMGEPYGLRVDSVPGEGTCVTVLLPLLREKPRA